MNIKKTIKSVSRLFLIIAMYIVAVDLYDAKVFDLVKYLANIAIFIFAFFVILRTVDCEQTLNQRS
jgi:hypothetical protein